MPTRRDFLVASGTALAGATLIACARTPIVSAARSNTGEESGTVTIIQFDDSGQKLGPATVKRVQKTDAEWKRLLTPLQFEVTRQQGTERAFTGQYYNLHEKGLYRCICCDNALFNSDTKFESGTGWPSFSSPTVKENIRTETDASHGMVRAEVLCAHCGAHLGHVFPDVPRPTGLRYCMNSASLDFKKE